MTESNAHLADEISRQSSMIEGELWPRNFLASFALLLAGIYVSLWYILPAILALFATDLLAIRYMRNLHPDREPLRYQVVLILVFLREFSFTIVAAAVWQHTEGFAQPLAIGMVTTQLLQLAMIRAIHLPIGKIGLLGATIPVLIGNMIFWQANGLTDVGFLLTTLAGCGGLAYGLIAMQSNHRIHMASTADRAAALAADKAKSRFLAQMSHELRTPLNAILGMGHAELRRSTDVLSQQRLAVLIASAEGLSTILDDILDMSAVEEGRLPLRPAAVVPSDEIAATLALFQPGIEEAGLGLTRDIPAALCQPLMLDPQRLRQCLSNLLSNALKNTPDGGIHVSAQLSPSSPGQSLLRIEVTDTGPGIPAQQHSRIFEPFARANLTGASARSPSGSAIAGNGLGLSICRAMAQQMGGDLTLSPDSTEGRGARFILTLRVEPATDNTAPLHTPPEPAIAGGTETPSPPGEGIANLRVLVVDDIATNRLVAATYLWTLGATMQEAASGDEALEILQTHVPDLLLLDMQMPGMTGLQTLARIRALPGSAGKVPVIAMTADAMAEHRKSYLSAGVDGYLAKPITAERIMAEIAKVMDKGDATPAQ